MPGIFGYGEDSLTLWALKNCRAMILNRFCDRTPPSDCSVFYRPSFGRRGGRGSQFGEFDGILVSRQNVYLIESKWKRVEPLRPEQELRHRILTWYIDNWSEEYESGEHEDDWDMFRREHGDAFDELFGEHGKRIPNPETDLARNLRFVLARIRTHCGEYTSEGNVKNVLLYFHGGDGPTPSKLESPDFTLVPIDYGGLATEDFIDLN